MSSVSRRDTFRLILIICWLVFTVTFAIWWFKLSTGHISQLLELQPEQSEHWLRQKRMVFWEGSAWIVLLALGGAALIALVQKEKSRVRKIKEFFASFSHEVKTSLASLRLQAEALKDDSPPSPILDRLIGDTVRLQVQLENSLFFASQDALKLYLEPVALSAMIERMREQWPNLQIQLNREAVVRADERAIRTIFSNLLQNALVHGKATKVNIDVENDSAAGKIRVSVYDDGVGYKGDHKQLGQLFYRPTSSSGSGLGLYICRLLVERMGGSLNKEAGGEGFRVGFDLPGDKA